MQKINFHKNSGFQLRPLGVCVGWTHVTSSGAKEQHVEWDCSDGVDGEPALDVVLRDLLRFCDDLPAVDVGRPEVDEDVSDEHDVDDEVDDDEGVGLVGGGVLQPRRRVVVQLRLPLVLVEEEGGHVRREDGRVEDKKEHDPVPDRLEGRVV